MAAALRSACAAESFINCSRSPSLTVAPTCTCKAWAKALREKLSAAYRMLGCSAHWGPYSVALSVTTLCPRKRRYYCACAEDASFKRISCWGWAQTTPLMAGLGVAAAAYASRAAVLAFQSFKTAPPRLRQFYKVRGVLMVPVSCSRVGNHKGAVLPGVRRRPRSQ